MLNPYESPAAVEEIAKPWLMRVLSYVAWALFLVAGGWSLVHAFSGGSAAVWLYLICVAVVLGNAAGKLTDEAYRQQREWEESCSS